MSQMPGYQKTGLQLWINKVLTEYNEVHSDSHHTVGDTTTTTAPSINDRGVSTTGMNVTKFTVTDMLENSTVLLISLSLMNLVIEKPLSQSLKVLYNTPAKQRNVVTNSQASLLTDISKGEVYGTKPSITLIQLQLGPRLQGVTQKTSQKG